MLLMFRLIVYKMDSLETGIKVLRALPFPSLYNSTVVRALRAEVVL